MSRLMSTRWPCFIAKLREVAALCAMIRKKHDSATPITAGMSVRLMPCGRPIGGRPPCTGPITATPWLVASSAFDRMIERITAITAPGILRLMSLQPTMMTSVPRANSTVHRFASATCVMVYHCCSNQLPLPFGMPSMLGDLPRQHLDADAGEEADQHRGAEEVAEEAEPQQAREDQQHTADQCDQARPGDPLGRIRREPGDAETGEPRGQDRRRRGVGTDHEQARRTEQREQQRREDDRVQARDHRRLRDRGVAHHLGDGDRGEGHTGDQISGQPARLVLAHPLRDDFGDRGHAVHLSSSRGTPSGLFPIGSKLGPFELRARHPWRVICDVVTRRHSHGDLAPDVAGKYASAMTRRPPSILGGSPSGGDVEVRWEVDSFFGDSEAPEKVLIELNGAAYKELDGDETSVTIPAAAISALGAQVVNVGVVFWWSGPPVEEQHSVFTFTVAGPANGGVFPAATPAVNVVRVVPRTSSGAATITIAWRSNNYNDGNIVWGPESNATAFRHSIRPRGEHYSGEFTTDQMLSSGVRYVFRVEVRNTLHSPGWLASTITVAVPAALSSVREYLLLSGKPVPGGIAAFVGPARSVRTWIRG